MGEIMLIISPLILTPGWRSRKFLQQEYNQQAGLSKIALVFRRVGDLCVCSRSLLISASAIYPVSRDFARKAKSEKPFSSFPSFTYE